MATERINALPVASTLPGDGVFAIDSTAVGTRQITPAVLMSAYGILKLPVAPPAVSTFTWYNQSVATAADVTGGILINNNVDSASGGENANFLAKPLGVSKPYTIIAGFRDMCDPVNTYAMSGIVLQESGTGKLIMFGNMGYTTEVVGRNMNNPTSYNSGTFTHVAYFGQNSSPYRWVKVTDDGTNRNYYFSPDGINWIFRQTDPTDTYCVIDQCGPLVWTLGPRQAIILLVSYEVLSGIH